MKKTMKKTMAVLLAIMITVSFMPVLSSAATVTLHYPTGVKAVSTSSTSITLSWKKVKNAKGYKIYKKRADWDKYRMVKKITRGSTVKWLSTDLKKGKKYYYKIRAINGKKYSKFSKVVKAVPKPNMKERLQAIDGVSSVKTIKQTEGYIAGKPMHNSKYKYLVTFQQPLDWSNPESGTFPQRVEVAIDNTKAATVYECEGYLLNDVLFTIDDRQELSKMLNGNNINIEYRFFGKSKPKGLSNSGTEYWEYLTVENAAADEHKIITELSKILTGKRIVTGTSKGGLNSNTFTYHYPKDMDLTVSYVAPLCNENDNRFYDAVYNTIYSENYGKRERKALLDFQLSCLKYKDQILPLFKDYLENNSFKFRTQATPEIVYDVAVLETSVSTWQNYQNFDLIEEYLAMPENTAKKRTAKVQAAENVLETTGTEVNYNNAFFPYFVQAAKELGNYYYDFSYLRQAAEEAGLDDKLSVQKNHLYSAGDLLFTKKQKAAFQYDPTLNYELKDWVKTTDNTVIMIYGTSDPWNYVRIPDADEINPNIHIFTSMRDPHTARLTEGPLTGEYSFGKPTRTKIQKIIDNALQ